MTTSSASPKKAVRKAAPRKRSATAKRPAAKKVPAVKPVSVLIVGAGFAGLGMAIRLKQAGI
ncbi:MAG TPA: 4-hydroxyacetophenone monooxygenase, partial [Alcanivorax sp.]|nr:4-hydroxyacetophenone monooxygenase [Alcanivorax sp.]